MRISLCSEVIRELPEQQCAFARAVDYDGLEIAPFMWSDEPHLLSPLRRAQVPRQGRHRRWETPCRDAPQWRGEVARSLAQPTCVAPRRVLDWDLGPQRVSGMRFEQSMGHQDRLMLSQGMRM